MADTMPAHPVLVLTPAPLADPIFVRDDSLPAATLDDARAAYVAAVEALARLQLVATRRASALRGPARSVALSTVERRTQGAMADVLAVAIAAGVVDAGATVTVTAKGGA